MTPITKTNVQEMIDEANESLKKFVKEEDERNYLRLSALVHTTSPATKRKISELSTQLTDIKTHLEDVHSQLKNHDDREKTYWNKLDTLVDGVKKNTELLEENIVGIQGVTSLINSSKILKAFVAYVIFPLGSIIGTIYAIKNWILK